MNFMSKLARRSVLLGVTTAIAGTAFLTEPLIAQEERTITIWFGRQNFIPDNAFEPFMRDNPGITVKHEVIRLEDASAQLILALRSGNAPDILQIYERDALTLAAGGALVDFSEQIAAFEAEFPETYSQLSPTTWSSVTDSEGGIYGVDLFNMSVYLTYRRDWLEEAGVSLPLETTDQVLDAARALTELKGSGAGFSLIGCCVSPTWELPLFRAMGGQYVEYVPQIDNEIGVEWIEFYQTLVREGLASSDTASWDSGQMRAAFIGGRAGMANIGEHIYVAVEEQMPYEEGAWEFTRLPTRPGQTEPHVQTGYGFPYVVTAGNDDPDAAMRVLAYLAHKDIAQEVAIRYLPTNNTAVNEDEEYRIAKPWAEDISPISSTLEILPNHPTRQIQISNVLIELRDRMVAQPNVDAAALAAEYQAKLNAAAGG